MESLAAVGLACNILQLVETGLKISVRLKRAYCHDENKEQQDVSRLSNTLSAAIDELHRSMQYPLNKDDSELNDIAEQCLKRISKLRDILKSLTASSSSTLEKLKLGIKVVKQELSGEITKIESELEKLRDAFNTRILVSLRSRHDLILAQQGASFSFLRVDLQEFIRQQAQLQTQEHQGTRQLIQYKTAELSQQLISVQASEEVKRQRERLLDSLRYPRMNAKRTTISSTYPETFEWLFAQIDSDSVTMENYGEYDEDCSEYHHQDCDSPWDTRYEENDVQDHSKHSDEKKWAEVRNTFRTWLRDDSRLYWVSGKPGSGKSTLIKYIAEHSSTRQLLEEWSGSQDLVIVECYLWSDGLPEHKSFRGLLASLLLQVLQKSSGALDLIAGQKPDACYKSTIMDWSVEELQSCLVRCFQPPGPCVCVFIDGLDEAEVETASPEHSITQFIDRLAALPNVKCCVSSRPLWRFEIAFAEGPHLRLEELNRMDIMRYYDGNVTPVLKDVGFDTNDEVSSKLRRKFATRAHGLFLWACLAANSLICGIQHCDRLDELTEKLQDLPVELEGLYHQMWQRQSRENPRYGEEASRFFNICIICGDMHTHASVLDLVLLQPNNFHLCDEILSGTIPQQLEQECQRIRVLILTRCGGLLTVPKIPDQDQWPDPFPPKSFPALRFACFSNVRFIHQTAKDFLWKSALGKTIRSLTPLSELDVRRQLVRIRLCRDMLECPSPEPEELQLLVESNLVRSSNEEYSFEMLQDAVDIFRDWILRLNPHLGPLDWFIFPREPGYESSICQPDFMGEMILGSLDWLCGRSLEHYRVGDLNHEYIIYMLCLWILDKLLKESLASDCLCGPFDVPLPSTYLGLRISVSQLYLEALRVHTARLTVPWCSGELPKWLSNLPALIEAPFALHEKCLVYGAYSDDSPSSQFVGSPIVELQSVIPASCWNAKDTIRIQHWAESEVCVIFECNVAFLLQAMMGYVKEIRTRIGISDRKSMQNTSIEPTIRALCLITRVSSGASSQDEKGYSMKEIGTPASDIVCAVFRSGRMPQLQIPRWQSTWKLSQKEYRDVTLALNGEKAVEVSCLDFMYELGHVPLDSPKVARWPPPLRSGDIQTSIRPDSDQTGDEASLSERVLETQSDRMDISGTDEDDSDA